MSIITIDAHYLRPYMAAVHLIVEQGRAAFVDTGSYRSVPYALAALQENGLTPADVHYVLLTHVHLDHAGGAGHLMQALPNAKCVVHPRGAKHMIDPTKLSIATKEVYGAERFAEMYGELLPIPAERVLAVDDGQKLILGGRELEFIHTPGHANHHVCIVDRTARAIFTGDTFGLAYRELNTEQGAFIFPTSSPSHFDPDAAHRSIDRLTRYQPEAMYLTHYSRVTGVAKLAAELHEQLDAYVAMARKFAQSSDRTQSLSDAMTAYLFERLDRHGVRKDAQFRHEVLDGDIELNVQGLEFWLDHSAAR